MDAWDRLTDRAGRAVVAARDLWARARPTIVVLGRDLWDRVKGRTAARRRLWGWIKHRWRSVSAGVLVTLVVVPAAHWAWSAWDAPASRGGGLGPQDLADQADDGQRDRRGSDDLP